MPTATNRPSVPLLARRATTRATIGQEAMYQTARTLILSHSQGASLITLGIKKHRAKRSPEALQASGYQPWKGGDQADGEQGEEGPCVPEPVLHRAKLSFHPAEAPAKEAGGMDLAACRGIGKLREGQSKRRDEESPGVCPNIGLPEKQDRSQGQHRHKCMGMGERKEPTDHSCQREVSGGPDALGAPWRASQQRIQASTSKGAPEKHSPHRAKTSRPEGCPSGVGLCAR